MWGKLFGELIINGRYDYTYVVTARPDFKVEINAYLTEQGHGDLIVG